MEAGRIRALIIEDNQDITANLYAFLEPLGYELDCSANGHIGLEMAVAGTFDVIVLDIMLPGMDGLAVCRALREEHVDPTPILMLTARDTVADRVTGLDCGADDYLVKPFSFSELIARIQALLRRASATAEPSTLTVGDLSIDLLSRKVYRGSTRIDIQPLEFTLLEYLARNAGRVVSKTMIMEHVWEYNFDPQTNIVETRMCRLREKLDKPFKEKLLHTVRGFGYVLEPEADFRHR